MRWKMSAFHTTLSSLPSLCQKFSQLMEIWQSSDKNNNAQFFWDTVCIVHSGVGIRVFKCHCDTRPTFPRYLANYMIYIITPAYAGLQCNGRQTRGGSCGGCWYWTANYGCIIFIQKYKGAISLDNPQLNTSIIVNNLADMRRHAGYKLQIKIFAVTRLSRGLRAKRPLSPRTTQILLLL